MRGLSSGDGFATNTRVIITEIQTHSIRVQTLKTKKSFIVPKITFKIQMSFASYKLTRQQFPLKLAYAMTDNKSQGQEFDKVVVDTTKHCFSHGHLYVALSRIRSAHDIKIYCSECDIVDGILQTTNVVYKEILF
jgi:ATP-dependent exoDNAse (exonuclease V) alpha subunit